LLAPIQEAKGAEREISAGVEHLLRPPEAHALNRLHRKM
jgi:hypothetical protein